MKSNFRSFEFAILCTFFTTFVAYRIIAVVQRKKTIKEPSRRRNEKKKSSVLSTSVVHHVVRHFVTGNFIPQRVFLPDKEYGLALDALVKACSDVLVLSSDGDKILLGKRKVEPQPDWWFIGGRAKPGDTTRDAASRNVKRELGLDLSVDRFCVIATYSMVWRWRAQAPAENGTADISTVHTLQLTAEEQAQVKLDMNEYANSAYVSFEDILSGNYHPCLKQAVRDLLKQRALDDLIQCAATDKSSSISEIAASAMTFVAMHKAGIGEKESTKVHFLKGRYTCT